MEIPRDIDEYSAPKIPAPDLSTLTESTLSRLSKPFFSASAELSHGRQSVVSCWPKWSTPSRNPPPTRLRLVSSTTSARGVSVPKVDDSFSVQISREASFEADTKASHVLPPTESKPVRWRSDVSSATLPRRPVPTKVIL